MNFRGMTILIPAVLAACAAQPGATPAPGPTAESTVVSAIGTPFLIAFKIPLCVATVLVEGPASGAAAIIPPQDNPEQAIAHQVLADGLRDNCGPPYIVPR